MLAGLVRFGYQAAFIWCVSWLVTNVSDKASESGESGWEYGPTGSGSRQVPMEKILVPRE
jgi:hypothetical protein